MQIHINLLGNFDLRANGNSLPGLSRSSSKLRNILCYLILYRNRSVTQSELIETFYEDERQSNPAGALKMQIMRIRNLLEKLFGRDVSPIISHRGSYQWNPEIECIVDVEVFEQLCVVADCKTLSNTERIEYYKKAIELYKGEPLLESDDVLWSKSLSVRYYNRFIEAIEEYFNLLMITDNYCEIENRCLEVIQRDSSNEKLHIWLIRALLKQKKYAQARNHYKNTVDMLYRSLGVQPSPELKQLYTLCEEEEKPLEADLSFVMEEIRSMDIPKTAFVCNFEQFKCIYHLEERRASRTGDCLHVAMITVLGIDGKVLSPEINNIIIDGVQQTIINNLRQGDVVARYSNCQFIIMLPSANQEDSCLVMERIINNYHSNNPKKAINLIYQVRELELLRYFR